MKFLIKCSCAHHIPLDVKLLHLFVSSTIGLNRLNDFMATAWYVNSYIGDRDHDHVVMSFI